MSNRAIAVLFILVLAFSFAAHVAFAQSGEHGDGHAQMHDTYKGWRLPNNQGTSCCNDNDCRPTRAYVDEEGRWRVWNGIMWLVVPWDRVLPADFAHDGRSHLCEQGGTIYCFTSGEIRG